MELPEIVFDILICVKDALVDLEPCLQSIINHDGSAHRLIIVDDNSRKETKEFLEKFKNGQDNIILLTNTETVGYTKSLNRGLRGSEADFILVANSDIIATPQWHAKMLRPMLLDAKVAITGPISNAASWQSVPEIFDPDGSYKVNSLPYDLALESFAAEIEKMFIGQSAQVSLVNGFCMALRSSLVQEIGLFDEENFPIGYGEETDYCLRASQHGYECCVVLDTYVYHHKSRSFGVENRNRLAIQGRKSLHRLYGENRIRELYGQMKNHESINVARKRIREQFYH
jgi:GT2 family glycosyltransferase